jgi:hypothetical protein
MLSEAVDYEMEEIDEKDDNENELHTKLHEDCEFTLNSINLVVGQTGCGKSRKIFRALMKLKYLDHPYHTAIYVADEENDKTFIKYRALIPITVVHVHYKDAYEFLTQLIGLKNAYEKHQRNPQALDNNEKNVLLQQLYVKDMKIPMLHTIVIFDDATEIFLKKKYEDLSELLLKNRHHKFTYFFNVHYFTSKCVPSKLKDNMRTLSVFGGYSKMVFSHMYQQMRSPVDRKELYDYYKMLGRRDVLFFDYDDEGTKFELIPLGQKKDGEWFERTSIQEDQEYSDSEDIDSEDEPMTDDEIMSIIKQKSPNGRRRDNYIEDSY